MKFLDELWKITPPFLKRQVLKEKSDTWVYLSALGEIFDEARSKVFLLRRQALVPTAEGKALDKHGNERRLPRFSGESDEDYRLRLSNFRNHYLYGGTRKGMIDALHSLDHSEAEFYPLYMEKYKDDPVQEYLGKWSQFIVFVYSSDRPLDIERYKVLLETIDEVKPPESKLYLLGYVLTSEIGIGADCQGYPFNYLFTGDYLCGTEPGTTTIGKIYPVSIEISATGQAYPFSYLFVGDHLCGTKPETAIKGKAIEASLKVSSEYKAFGFNYQFCGTKPNTATKGKSIEAAVEVSAECEAFGFDYQLCGTEPETATIGQIYPVTAEISTDLDTYKFSYPPTGTLVCGAYPAA